MNMLGRAKSVPELHRKVSAAKVLIDGEDLFIHAIGEFVTDDGEIVFIRYNSNAEVKSIGRKYVEIDLGDEGTVRAYPACDANPRIPNEFIISPVQGEARCCPGRC